MQTKDITDILMFDALAATRGRHGVPHLSALWDIEENLSEIPRKLVASKLRGMIRRKLIDGCGCGCRGDFELMPFPSMVPQ